MKTTLMFIALYILSTAKLLGQAGVNLPQITPASPQAAAIAKYINYPVDYSTGLPNINIPLYVVKSGDITLPISISYHASGLKVTEGSGWVGAGWTLNAEPGISRSIKGRPDEDGYMFFNYPDPIDNVYYAQLVDLTRDEEPDEFYYKLFVKERKVLFQKRGPSYQRPLHDLNAAL